SSLRTSKRRRSNAATVTASRCARLPAATMSVTARFRDLRGNPRRSFVGIKPPANDWHGRERISRKTYGRHLQERNRSGGKCCKELALCSGRSRCVVYNNDFY